MRDAGNALDRRYLMLRVAILDQALKEGFAANLKKKKKRGDGVGNGSVSKALTV